MAKDSPVAKPDPVPEKKSCRAASLDDAPTVVQEDYFVSKQGLRFAGTHLLVELWEADNLNDPETVESALRKMTEACEASLLHLHIHQFSPGGGISGVAVLAESHMSIHTWPERNYAAIDIFLCGGRDPYKAIPEIKRAFLPGAILLNEQKRGILP